MVWTPDFSLAVSREGKRPLFERVGAALTDAIRAGRLAPGDRLPSTRRLAERLGIHRNTAIAAYESLAAQGWIQTARGRGTFVSRALPEVAPRAFAEHPERMPTRTGFPLAPAPRSAPPLVWPPPKGVLSLAGAVPDVRETPVADLARAYRRAVLRQPRQALDYGDEAGHPALRDALAHMLASLRGLPVGRDDVFVTRGSQQALYLAARTICRPGDVVAVESLGYAPAWEAFRAAGATLVGVPVDDRGVRVDRLAALTERQPLRAVYLTPHHQYPTLAVLAPERRIALLELARRKRFAVVEDDYDYEMHYEGQPLLPLASADRAGVVVYVGTLSKILAPGVRVGYAVAPRPLLERFALHRRPIDRQGDAAVEAAVAELLSEGIVERHARRMRRIYRARRDHLASEVRDSLGDALDFHLPPGGMALWLRARSGLDVDAWAQRSEDAGVHFLTAKRFAFDGRARSALRLGYAYLQEAELSDAIGRMRRVL
ncbi:MAG: PLP-dependent aminotransferase family protein [Myxococcota bacterium]